MFRTLGLGKLTEQQEHDDRVYRGIEPPMSDELKTILEHGTSQDINALVTLLGKILPVYYPHLLYKEDGCEVIPLGDSKAVSSGDGTGVDKNGQHEVAFEFKCPVPGEKHVTDVHYKLPIYYTTQVISQMASKGCAEIVYISFTPESSTYIHDNMDGNLWQQILQLAEYTYEKSEFTPPARRNPPTGKFERLLERL